ncbi:MAG: serine/threonine protein phosphatase 1 [Oleiphilaceae bacterium]|jgi:serine/threonine protein phosphatase 1
MSKLKTYLPNETGQDFICSDIHGHFSLLEAHLKKVGFDKIKDRLFCLGDLIDRGDESAMAIDYLNQPWFYSILGNHELMLIDAYNTDKNYVLQQWYQWGGAWAEDLSKEELAPFYEAMVELPMAIELNLKGGTKVGLVHAELPLNCSWNAVCSGLSAKIPSDNSTYTPLLHGMFWNKGQANSIDAALGEIEPVEHIDHVFHGHTIMPEITRCANRTFMDLGGYETGILGLVNVEHYLKLSASELSI